MWSEGRLFWPTLKNIPKAAFCLLSLTCSLNFLVTFLLPIYLHCHTSTSRVFTFSSAVPCQALSWRKVHLHKTQQKSQFESPQSLFIQIYINILWKNNLFGPEEKHPLVFTSVCNNSVFWTQAQQAVTAGIPILRLRSLWIQRHDQMLLISWRCIHWQRIN